MRPLMTVVLCVALAGCTTVSRGVPQAAEPPTSTTAAPASSTPAFVSPAQLQGSLLKRSEMADIVDDADIRVTTTFVKGDPGTKGVTPFECGALLTPGSATGFTTLKTQGLTGEVLLGSRGEMVGQMIAAFPDRSAPAKLLSGAQVEWSLCPAGQPFTVADPERPTVHWVPDGAQGSSTTRISITVVRQELPARSCHHTLSGKANVVVETLICGDGDVTAQADRIADQILLPIPE